MAIDGDLELIEETYRKERLPNRLMKRYRHAYRFSGWTNGFGRVTCLIGWCLGFAVVYLTGEAEKQLTQLPAITSWIRDTFHLNPINLLDVTGFSVAIVIVVIFVVLGTMISAVGQMAKSVIDTAVNTSPFVSTEEKLSLILPDTAASEWWKIIKLLKFKMTGRL